MEDTQYQALRRSAQWDAYNRVLHWINEQEKKEIAKGDLYGAVIDMRPDVEGCEPVALKAAGAVWWHSDDYASPTLTKASLGEFFAAVLSVGGHIGSVWPFNHRYARSAVYVSVYMTDEMRRAVEAQTRFRFRPPPRIKLN